MLSRISKISVFGIVALMLAFGMAAEDALAAKTTATVSQDQDNVTVRAATEVSITFTVALSGDSTEGDDKPGTVSISIPSVWSRPVVAPSGTTSDALKVGQVLIAGGTDDGADGAVADGDLIGGISGRNLVARAGKNATGSITFEFRTKTPARASVYTFPVSGPAFTVAYSGGASTTSVAIAVGPVDASTSGTVSLSPLTPIPFVKDANDFDPQYEGEYVLTAEAKERSLGTIMIRFVAAGTMPSGSTIILTSDGFEPFQRASADGREIAISGHVTPTIATDTGLTATATVKDGGIQKGAQVVFTIKNYKIPAQDGTLTERNIKVETTVGALDDVGGVADADFPAVSTAALVKREGGHNADTDSTITGGGAQFRFPILKKHGTGTLTITPSATIAADTAITGGTLTFAIGGTTGIGSGAKYEITIPAGWPEPFMPRDTASTADGAISGVTPAPTIEGRTIKGALDEAGLSGLVYRVAKSPKAQGAYTFSAKTSAGHHGAPVAIGGVTIEVTVGAGKGSVSLTQGGRPFSQTQSKANVGNLTFTFTPAGRMAKGAQVTIARPDGWTPFQGDNGDGTADPGEVTVSGKATIVVAAALITATASETLTPSDKLVFTYKAVTAPELPAGASRSDTFHAQAKSHGGETLGDIGDPSVGIGRAADGGGTLALSVTQADAGSAIGDLMITYTAAGKMEAGSTVEVTIPENGDWPNPTETGRVALSAGTLSTAATTMTATTDTVLNSGDTIVFTYKNLTAPATGGTYTFTAKSASSSIGTLTALSAGVTITVDEVAAGSVMLASAEGMLTSAAPGMALGNLTFTFTAGARMATGAQVQIQVPIGWTPAFVDNNDGTDAAGEVLVTGAADLSVSGGGGTPWILTATTTAVLEVGNTLTFTYKMVTAPSSEATYPFMTKASLVSGGTLLPLSSSPQVIVRTPVTAIAAHAMPTSVFTDGEITVRVDLWSAAGELAKSLGTTTVMLSDGDAGGSFMDADDNTITSIMIADNMSEASATYMNSAAGMVTLTATSGDMTSSVEVEIKSTIRDLVVDHDLVQQGATIMVSATGKAGGGTVTVMDSDGDKVGTTKALDPIGDPDDDGDQEYSRSITLPATLPDGMYTISVQIQGDTNNSLMVEVLNDQTAPMLSDASALPMTVMNGGVLTLSVKASSGNEIASVTADVNMLDSTKTDAIALTELTSAPGTYTTIVTISGDNTADDGEKTVTFTATDRIGNSNTMDVMVTLENDPSMIESVNVPSEMFRPGDMVMITMMGTAGGTAAFTVTSSDGTAMPDGKAMEEGPDGTYTGTFAVVADVHTEGVYDVTVNLGTKSSTMADSLNIGPAGYMFTLSIPAGTHAIHIPLDVNMINGEDGTIDTVGDVYDALGDAVNFIITLGADGSWMSYLGDASAGSMADAAIGDDTGLIAVMKSAATLELVGDALGTGGVSQISVSAGNNLVGVPLDPAVDMMISDALVAGVGAIAVSNAAGDGFHTITAAGDMGDGPVMGGVGYIVVATADASIPVIGTAWENDGAAAAPAVVFSGSQTPVLHVDGGVMDEFDMLAQIPELRVTVKNLSTGASLDTVVGTDETKTAYSATFVEFGRHAAKAGDVLEITAHSPNPYVGVRPVPQIVVSADEVLTSRIELPDLELYEIPSETELLANFPNPFNPETWIPYRLAKAAEVTLSIYDTNGRLVRSIDVGFKPAAVYESRASAIYWDGRNNYGERVASGTYFYHLTAGDDYASTRRMVILK